MGACPHADSGGIRWGTLQVQGLCGRGRGRPLKGGDAEGVSCRVSSRPLASDADPTCVRRTAVAGSLGSGGLMPPVRGSRTRYFLQPRDNGSKSLKPGDLGSLRLNVVYTEDHVFSSDYYSPLRDLLLKSADVEVPAWPPHGPARLHPAPGSLPPPPPLW